MNTSTQHNIGALIAIATSVSPQLAPAGSIAGAGIDRFAHGRALSCVLHQVVGAETGAPTTMSVQTKLQHAPDNATWTDYVPPATAAVAQTSALTQANTESSLPIDLSSAQRYVRAVSAIAFTGGNTPEVQVAADIVLGGQDRLPAA